MGGISAIIFRLFHFGPSVEGGRKAMTKAMEVKLVEADGSFIDILTFVRPLKLLTLSGPLFGAR